MNATTGNITPGSPYLVRFSHSSWQMAYTLGIWAAEHGIKSAHTLAAGYAAGIDNEAAFIKGFSDSGGTISGKEHTPLNTADYLPYMDCIKTAKQQALFAFTLAGPATIATTKAFSGAGLQTAGVELPGTGDEVPDDELKQTGPAEKRMIEARSTLPAKNPANVGFVKAWKEA